MIKIVVARDKEGFIWRFTVKGHAGFAEKGSDIICAAVSAIAYTAVGALKMLVGIKNYTERDGFMKCSIPADIAETKKNTTRIILETAIIGFKQIELSYEGYVSVVDEEV